MGPGHIAAYISAGAAALTTSLTGYLVAFGNGASHLSNDVARICSLYCEHSSTNPTCSDTLWSPYLVYFLVGVLCGIIGTIAVTGKFSSTRRLSGASTGPALVSSPNSVSAVSAPPLELPS